MSKRYAKFLGPTLQAKIEELSNEPHQDQVNLYDEIALARLSATQAIKLAEPILNGELDVKATTQELAMSCLRDAMIHVKDMVLAASKIESNSEDKVSLRVIDLIVQQIIKAIHGVCDDQELADKIERAVRENVRLPDRANGDTGSFTVDGVENTPDVIVSEMDASICGD